MDQIDRKILEILQKDATMSTSEIADIVGLSTTPCWRRIQNLEKDGYIMSRVVLVDRTKVNCGMDVFVAVTTSEHTAEWLDAFAKIVADMPEVVELYRLSGHVDYMMRVVVPDMAAYDDFYKRLIGSTRLSDVSSSFAMEQIKYTTAVPLDYVNGRVSGQRKK